MQKWEYCAIVGMARNGTNLATATPALWQFTPAGIQSVNLGRKHFAIAGKEFENEADAVAAAIANLGAEGWELVGVGQTAIIHHLLYFKRPLPASS